MIPSFVLPGDKRRSKLDSVQQRLDALLLERAKTERAPIAAAEFKNRIKSDLQRGSALANRAIDQSSPRPRSILEPGLALSLSDLAWLFGAEAITEHVCLATAEYLASQPAGIDAATRAKRLNEINTDLEKLQQDEEREVLALVDAGIPVIRRENADPRILLAAWQKESDA